MTSIAPLLLLVCSFVPIKPVICSLNPETEYVLCRKCGSDLADLSYLENRYSPEALIRSNQTVFNKANVGVQLLRNPVGIEFQIVTLSKAGCVGYKNWHTDHSWFPGYGWKPCVCQHCGHHLGWVFEPISTIENQRNVASERGFYALILDNILSESFSNSLIAPVTYRF